MSVWQRLNAPRNKRENRVAKIARDQERERIIALLEGMLAEPLKDGRKAHSATEALLVAIARIKGKNK